MHLVNTTVITPFRFMVETIIGQMLSNKVDNVLAERIEALYNESVKSEVAFTLDVNNGAVTQNTVKNGRSDSNDKISFH